MTFVTDFGDAAVLLPMAAAVLIWLLASRAPKAAVWWLAAVLIVIGGVGLMKIFFFACLHSRFQSPSGHTGLSTAVYGALAAVIVKDASGWRSWLIAIATALFVAAIATSRLILGAHTLPEVGAGLATGVVALAAFVYGYAKHQPARRSVTPLILGSVAILVLLHGRELRAEALLHTAAQYLLLSSKTCG